MTMRYTHIGIRDRAKAVANLPAPKSSEESAAPVDTREDRALQMRCIFCGAERHSVTSAGNGQAIHKRENPCQCKGSDASRHQLAVPGKMEAAGKQPLVQTLISDSIC